MPVGSCHAGTADSQLQGFYTGLSIATQGLLGKGVDINLLLQQTTPADTELLMQEVSCQRSILVVPAIEVSGHLPRIGLGEWGHSS